MSLVLSFILWLFVMDYEDPTITKTFKGITVEKLNIDSEALQNKYIEYKEGEEVDVVVKGSRSLIDNMTYDDIYAYVDFNKISFTGAIDIEVDVSDYSDNIQVMSKTPTDMLVEYEDIISEQRRVQYYFEGESPENYMALEPIFSPSYIEITGPETEVKAVSSVLVSIPIENEQKDITLLAKPQILDSNNNVINTVTSSTAEISVTVPVEKLKTIPLTFERIGNVALGHQLMDVTLSETEVTIQGDPDVVDEINEIIVDTISLTDLKESQDIEVAIPELLPNNVELYSNTEELIVSISIEPIVDKIIEIQHSDITVKYLSDNMQFSYLSEDVITINLRGVEEDLERVSVQYLSPYIRLYDLEEGEHQVELYYTIPYRVHDNSTDTVVNILLTKAEEEVIEETTETTNEDVDTIDFIESDDTSEKVDTNETTEAIELIENEDEAIDE